MIEIGLSHDFNNACLWQACVRPVKPSRIWFHGLTVWEVAGFGCVQVWEFFFSGSNEVSTWNCWKASWGPTEFWLFQIKWVWQIKTTSRFKWKSFLPNIDGHVYYNIMIYYVLSQKHKFNKILKQFQRETIWTLGADESWRSEVSGIRKEWQNWSSLFEWKVRNIDFLNHSSVVSSYSW